MVPDKANIKSNMFLPEVRHLEENSGNAVPNSFQSSLNACSAVYTPLAELSSSVNQKPLSSPGVGSSLPSKRVIQRELVYVIGLPPSLADEDLLKKQEYFGQYGEIKKLVVNTSKPFKTPKGNSYSAYINFTTEVEASLCIRACDTFTVQGRTLKVTFGTTKYCSFYLRHQRCPSKDCTYLHAPGNKEDYLTKDELLYKHIQPKNSLFPYLEIQVFKDEKCVLPSARLMPRQRYFSEDLYETPVKKERFYSVDLSSPNLHYRSAFCVHSDEEPPIVSYKLKKLVNQIEVATEFSVIDSSFSELLENEMWVKDVLRIETNRNGLLVKRANSISNSY